jgi:hypothetical protein
MATSKTISSGSNMAAVSPKKAKAAVRHAMKSNRPIFLWGPPGIGKSDIIKQIGVDLNAPVIDIRLSLWEPTDIKGIPYFNSNHSAMEWAPPVELPSEEFASQHDHVVVVFEEMNSAAPAVQAAAYQLILDRKVGTYKLPDNVIMVAAGNREGDKGVTFRMPAPLANRFIHLEVEVDFDDWLEWAALNRVHEDVVGYLSCFKGDLFNFDTKVLDKAFPTPRSWVYVSDILSDGDPDPEIVKTLVAGSVGMGLATKFMAHRKHSANLPNPTDVLSGKVKKLSKKLEISAQYALITSLCYELDDQNQKLKKGDISAADFGKVSDYFFTFLSDNFEVELNVMAGKLAMSTYKIRFAPDSKAFQKFAEAHAEIIVQAAGWTSSGK